jgi:ribosomal protein S18 acetylase RimI-like enzyme
MDTAEAVRYQRMEPQHLKQVATLHEASFPGYYLTKLGPSFLSAMYGWYVEAPEAIAYVALDDHDRVVGFVAGTSSAESYHRSLFRRRAAALLLALAGRLVAHPLLTLSLIWERKDLLPQAVSSGLSRAASPAPDASSDASRELCEGSLVSIGVEPSRRRQGIASRLTELFLMEAALRGCPLVTLSVREDNLPARNFYESLHWSEVARSSDEYHGSISITYQKRTSEEDE